MSKNISVVFEHNGVNGNYYIHIYMLSMQDVYCCCPRQMRVREVEEAVNARVPRLPFHVFKMARPGENDVFPSQTDCPDNANRVHLHLEARPGFWI